MDLGLRTRKKSSIFLKFAPGFYAQSSEPGATIRGRLKLVFHHNANTTKRTETRREVTRRSPPERSRRHNGLVGRAALCEGHS